MNLDSYKQYDMEVGAGSIYLCPSPKNLCNYFVAAANHSNGGSDCDFLPLFLLFFFIFIFFTFYSDILGVLLYKAVERCTTFTVVFWN